MWGRGVWEENAKTPAPTNSYTKGKGFKHKKGMSKILDENRKSPHCQIKGSKTIIRKGRRSK